MDSEWISALAEIKWLLTVESLDIGSGSGIFLCILFVA